MLAGAHRGRVREPSQGSRPQEPLAGLEPAFHAYGARASPSTPERQSRGVVPLDDPALQLLARIVHGADVADDRDATPQSRGLLAVAEGFHLLELGDHRQLELSLPVYDALYAWCKHEVGDGPSA